MSNSRVDIVGRFVLANGFCSYNNHKARKIWAFLSWAAIIKIIVVNNIEVINES